MLDSSRRLRMDESRPPFPPHDPCGQIDADMLPIAAGVRPPVDLEGTPAILPHDRAGRSPADLLRESSFVVYCGNAELVSEGFAIALRAMGVETNFLLWDSALPAIGPNRKDN
jgi:hypothetical protein